MGRRGLTRLRCRGGVRSRPGTAVGVIVVACPAFPEASVLRRWLRCRPWRNRRRMLERFAEQCGVRPERVRELFEMCRRAGVFRKWHEVSCPRCGFLVGSFPDSLPGNELECPDCGDAFAPGGFPWRVREAYELVEPALGGARSEAAVGSVCVGECELPPGLFRCCRWSSPISGREQPQRFPGRGCTATSLFVPLPPAL